MSKAARMGATISIPLPPSLDNFDEKVGNLYLKKR
jgi:hypothetical protein